MDPESAQELELEQLKQRALKEAHEGGWVTIHTPQSEIKQHDSSSFAQHSHQNESDHSPLRKSSSDHQGNTQKRKIERISSGVGNEPQVEEKRTSEPLLKRVKQEQTEHSPNKTTVQRRGGLLAPEEIAQEISEKKKEEEQRFAMRSPSELGKGAKTVYRDRHGRPLEMLTQFLNQEKGVYIDNEDANMEWGKGYVDPKEKEEQKMQSEEEKGRPYRGRTLEDPELNEEWREKDRWGDPMAQFLTKKHKESKKKKHKVYQGQWPPNRFNIPPAAEWDGVDRSNGYERNYFLHLNEKKAMQEIAYKYLSEDM